MARSPLKPERIRVDQAAAILGINKRTVQLMALRGELPNAAKIGGIWTFDEAALRGYIEQRVQRPNAKPSKARFQPTDRWMPLSERKAQKARDEALARLRELARRGK